jgi:hypothetical protein
MERKLKGSYKEVKGKLKGRMFCDSIKGKSIVPSIPFNFPLTSL